MIPMLRACLLAAALLPIPHFTSWAADQTITLRLGAGSTLMLERQFRTVLIGDPDVIGLHISPKGRGSQPPKPGSLHAWATEKFG